MSLQYILLTGVKRLREPSKEVTVELRTSAVVGPLVSIRRNWCSCPQTFKRKYGKWKRQFSKILVITLIIPYPNDSTSVFILDSRRWKSVFLWTMLIETVYQGRCSLMILEQNYVLRPNGLVSRPFLLFISHQGLPHNGCISLMN